MIDPTRHEITQREQVMAAFATAAVVDPDRLRADLDAAIEQDPSDREWISWSRS